MRARLIPALLVAAIVVAGCGSDSGTGSSTTSTGPSTTTTRPASEADDRIAKAGLLTTADLPEGFEPGRSGVTDFDTLLLRAERCEKFRKLATAAAAREVSPGFVRTNAVTSNTVKVFDLAVTPKAQIALLEDPKVTDCVGEVALRTIRREAGTTYDASVSPLAVDPVGDDALGFRTTVIIKGPNGTATEYLDEIIVRVDRATMTLRVVTDDLAEAAEVETTAVPKVVERLTTALG